jgi:hypothetical protein
MMHPNLPVHLSALLLVVILCGSQNVVYNQAVQPSPQEQTTPEAQINKLPPALRVRPLKTPLAHFGVRGATT